MDALLRAWVPPRLIETLAGVSVLAPANLRGLLVQAAGIHDIGKATPIFQGQLLQDAQVRAEFQPHTDQLAAAGYATASPVVLNPGGSERPFLARHELASAVILDQSIDRPSASPIAAVVAGHHGRWRFLPQDADVDLPVVCDYYKALIRDPKWSSAHKELQANVLEAMRAHDLETGPVVELDWSVLPVLTGLVCLADWIASSEQSIHAGLDALPLLGNAAEFYAERRDWTLAQLPAMLGTPTKPTGTFTDLFGFPPSRPIQRVLTAPRDPGLTAVMAPMGEGKTEAALGRWLTGASPGEGLYFAMPTMATADAMAARVQAVFRGTEPVLGSILHGRAILNEFYAPSSIDRIVTGGDERHSGLTPGDWFNGRHRGLLAPIAVGTVDQLLSAGLRHKFNFMRLLGASTKTVVLDEVHSYDPYMSTLLEGFLRWAGHLRIDVVLLSATLPSTRLAAYQNAYQSTSTHEPVPPRYPQVVHTPPPRQGETVVLLAGDPNPARPRHVALRYASHPTGSAGDRALALATSVDEARRGNPAARIGVLCNTVVTAQAVSSLLESQAVPHDVLHARLIAHARRTRTSDLLTLYGKTAPPGPRIMIATQLAEQSLDVDFDVLVTELCPASSLLQRLGRLWRHDSHTRPAGLARPTVTIAHPEPLPESAFAFLPYTRAEIARTWARGLQSGKRTEIRLPDDIQLLVEDCNVTLSDVVADLDPRESKDIVEHLTQAMAAAGAADAVTVPTPEALTGRRRVQALEAFSHQPVDGALPSTRWNDQVTITILPLSTTLPGVLLTALPKGPPTLGTVRHLLGHTVPVSGSLAHRVLGMADASETVTRMPAALNHRLLTDVLIIELDNPDSPVRYDALRGAYAVPAGPNTEVGA